MRTAQTRCPVDWIRDTKCHCAIECALVTGVIHHKGSYPGILHVVREWVIGRVRPKVSASSGLLSDAIGRTAGANNFLPEVASQPTG